MVVGDDIAVGGNDEARAQRLALVRLVRKRRAVLAAEALEEAIERIVGDSGGMPGGRPGAGLASFVFRVLDRCSP